jgi:hypothetical protein
MFNLAPEATHRGLVLIVIPDSALRRVVVRIARSGGFRAISVATLAQGRILLRGSSATISALVADLPGRDCEVREFLVLLRLWYPRAPALVLTDLAEPGGWTAAAPAMPIYSMEKPFTRSGFLEALARAMSPILRAWCPEGIGQSDSSDGRVSLAGDVDEEVEITRHEPEHSQ